MGLSRDARIVDSFLRSHDLQVVSAICKIGGIGKEHLGLDDEDKIACDQHETMCNPILQATVLNEAETEFNILLGLCVGHDALFFQHVSAPTTVMAVKDRVTGHNPMAAIYTLDSYHRALKP